MFSGKPLPAPFFALFPKRGQNEPFLKKNQHIIQAIGTYIPCRRLKPTVGRKNISYFQGANPHRGTSKAGYLFIRLLKQTAKDSALYLIHSSTHRGTGFGDRKFFTPFSPLLILFQDIHTHRLYSEHIALYQDL